MITHVASDFIMVLEVDSEGHNRLSRRPMYAGQLKELGSSRTHVHHTISVDGRVEYIIYAVVAYSRHRRNFTTIGTGVAFLKKMGYYSRDGKSAFVVRVNPRGNGYAALPFAADDPLLEKITTDTSVKNEIKCSRELELFVGKDK